MKIAQLMQTMLLKILNFVQICLQFFDVQFS
jgi:hypothetical protein